MRISLVRSLLVVIACLCGATNLAAKSDAVDNGFYTTKDLEYYLTPEELLFIRPGLEITILDVTIPADMKPEVTYTITDPAGQPLDHDGVSTPGVVDMRFTLANIPMGQEQKTRIAYVRIGRDSDGTLTMLAPGKYLFKFATAIGSDQDTTHTLVLGGRRDLREFELDRYADNAIKTWVPSGLYDAVPRDVVTAATCNRCHDPLQEHGRWQSPQACSQCHNPGLVEEGVNYRLDVLIHKVHAGLSLGDHDFSHVLYPADINDCQVCHTGGIPTEAFPLVATPNPVEVCDMSGLGSTLLSWGDIPSFDIRVNAADGPLLGSSAGAGSTQTGKWVKNGTTFFLLDKATGNTVQKLVVNTSALGCLTNAPGTPRGAAGAQHSNWLDHPSRAVCGSCHTGVNFETGEGHSEYQLIMMDDTLCNICHRPYTDNNSIVGIHDISITGVHQPLYSSAQFPGAIIELLDVTNTDPGDKPTVTFAAYSRSGALNPNTFNRIRFAINGPNEDFDFYAQEDALGKAVASGSNWTYTFATPLPSDAAGSYTVSVEGRNEVDIILHDGEVSAERDVIPGALLAFAVTDASATARRMVVDDYNCESCHVNLALHGGGRTNANYCVTCHMPAATDEEELQPGAMEQSIHFKYMIHSIHAGAERANAYVVAGHNQSVHDYGEVEYPGDLRNCDACHVNGSQQISSLPAGLLPTTTPQEWWDPMMPMASACLSCHNSDDAAAHAYSSTTFFGESCATCHGEGKSQAVDKAHAR